MNTLEEFALEEFTRSVGEMTITNGPTSVSATITAPNLDRLCGHMFGYLLSTGRLKHAGSTDSGVAILHIGVPD